MIPTGQIEQWLEEESLATPGEWTLEHPKMRFNKGSIIGTDCCDKEPFVIATPNFSMERHKEDSKLTVTARNNWRRVLEELKEKIRCVDSLILVIDQLRKENEALKAEVERLRTLNTSEGVHAVNELYDVAKDRDAWKQRAESALEVLLLIDLKKEGFLEDYFDRVSKLAFDGIAEYRASIEGEK